VFCHNQIIRIDNQRVVPVFKLAYIFLGLNREILIIFVFEESVSFIYEIDVLMVEHSSSAELLLICFTNAKKHTKH